MNKLAMVTIAAVTTLVGAYFIQTADDPETAADSEVQVGGAAAQEPGASSDNVIENSAEVPTPSANIEAEVADNTTVVEASVDANLPEESQPEPTSQDTNAVPETTADGQSNSQTAQADQQASKASHEQFARSFRNFADIAEREELAKKINGSFHGAVAGKSGRWDIELTVDGAVEEGSFTGDSMFALANGGIVVARMEGQGGMDHFKVTDKGEVVFTDIGDVEVEGETPSQYYIITIDFADQNNPAVALDRFDGKAIVAIGKSKLARL